VSEVVQERVVAHKLFALALVLFFSCSQILFAQDSSGSAAPTATLNPGFSTTGSTPSAPAAAAPAIPANDQSASTSLGTSPAVMEKELEVAMGIDAIETLDFDFSTKIAIGNEQLLKLIIIPPPKRQLIFRGLKPGRTSVTVRDNAGDVRLRYTVVVTATGKSNEVAELRELIGDVEGLEIGIKGGKVVISGEIVVPDDIGRVSKVLANYPSVLTLIELSPQTQRVIARKMSDELAKNNLKDVSVRVVNKAYWLEGVVSSDEKKKLALIIAKAYLPPKLQSLAAAEGRFATPDQSDIIDFIAVNEKKEPQPTPKMLKITSQFVELSKRYNRIFAFKWAPLMGADQSRISIGQTAAGNVTTNSSSTLSATISNLFPKLNSAKSAGYARVIQSGMVVVRDLQKGTIKKQTIIPYAVGSGDFTRAAQAKVGLNMEVTPRILEQERVELGISMSVDLSLGGSPPQTVNNEVNTNLVVKSKESAAIGGIVQNESSTEFDNPSNDPAPFGTSNPPPAPLFRLFRAKNYSTTKSQFVIFLTPEIIESASVGTEEIRRKFRRRE
jgi:pilus assembly protein CpaC